MADSKIRRTVENEHQKMKKSKTSVIANNSAEKISK